MSSNDYEFALLLQQQFQQEANVENPHPDLTYHKKKQKPKLQEAETKSLVDPSWELVDPTPDIFVLFRIFDEKYFWKKLIGVCVNWSKRMTSCAGVCCYGGYGTMCKITLSEPLLKLRPRKDLIETLLHEMIHAYLFVTHNNKDRDGHGPEFHKHMNRINNESGTNISVYHNFHDEVALYQQHWWRCNGPCQTRKPYFGMVRRATNRAPGAYDRWWAEHQRNCGGTFIKVKEPEKAPKKGAKAVVNNNTDIRKFYPVLKDNNSNAAASGASLSNVVGFKDLNNKKPGSYTKNSSSTIVVNKTTTNGNEKPVEKPFVSPLAQPAIEVFSGKGKPLSSKSSTSSSSKDYSAVRNSWINKFPTTSATATKRPSSCEVPASIDLKKPKITQDPATPTVACPVCAKLVPESELNAHLDLCLKEEENKTKNVKACPICDRNVSLYDYDDHLQACISGVFQDNALEVEEMVSCLVCDKKIRKSQLNAHLDECMSDKIFNGSKDQHGNENDEINSNEDKKYNCPVCFKFFAISEMSNHLDLCLSNNSENDPNSNFVNSMFDAF